MLGQLFKFINVLKFWTKRDNFYLILVKKIMVNLVENVRIYYESCSVSTMI